MREMRPTRPGRRRDRSGRPREAKALAAAIHESVHASAATYAG
jgi:hypothetical protein